MRNEPNLRIENYRCNEHPDYISPYGVNYGLFKVPGEKGILTIISSGLADHIDANNWEHVSVSYKTECPTWNDMDKIKKLFWRDDETVVQFHPREDKKKNFHENCLHLWKMANSEFILPPLILV